MEGGAVSVAPPRVERRLFPLPVLQRLKRKDEKNDDETSGYDTMTLSTDPLDKVRMRGRVQ